MIKNLEGIQHMFRTSVVLATYNGERYITNLLESIRKQSITPDEVIIVDDDSSDQTYRLVSEFIAHYNLETWVHLKNHNNLGYILNFRKALGLSQGDIVFLCDQDDVWLSNKIEVMLEKFKEKSEISALLTSFSMIDDSGHSIGSRRYYWRSNHGMLKKRLQQNQLYKCPSWTILVSNISPGCTLAVRSSVVKDYLAEPTAEKTPHDWALAVKAASDSGLFFLNKSTTLYRLHSENTIGIPSSPKSSKERALLIQKYEEMYAELGSFWLPFEFIKRLRLLERFSICRIQALRTKSMRCWLRCVPLGLILPLKLCLFPLLKDLVFIERRE